jgi:hypothetical protein
MSYVDYWLQLDRWSFKEAALLTTGHNPDEIKEVDFTAELTNVGKKSIATWEIPILERYQVFKRADWENYAGKDAIHIYSEEEAKPLHYFQLLGHKKININEELRNKWRAKVLEKPNLSDSDKNLIDEELKQKVGSNITKKLKILHEANIKFWNYYDPEDPSTAPTNAQVVEWVIDQKDETGAKISKHLANSMATILRDPSLPSGPRK